MVVANTINIGADIGALAAAAQLLIPVNFVILTLGFTALIFNFRNFHFLPGLFTYLKMVGLSPTCLSANVFIVSQPWQTIFVATFWPHMELNFEFFFIITGVLGTTISPYLFFWQTSQEVEEEKELHLTNRYGRSKIGEKFIRNLRIDNFMGMVFSEIATWSIIVVAATVLYQNGIANIASSAEAAKALGLLFQTFPAFRLLSQTNFCYRHHGAGFVRHPCIIGSAAYALTEAFNMKEGLNP